MKKVWDLLLNFWQHRKSKFFLCMKISMILLLVGVMHLSASTFSQTKVSLNMKDATVKEIFSSLEKITNYTFLYKLDLVDKCGKVDIDAMDKDFNQLLDDLLRPLGLSFKIDDRVVVITVREEDEKKDMVIIKGIVKDEKGQSLPGVTIVLKGTSVGVASDMEGKFTLSAPKQENLKLLFSFVGMKTKEIDWKGEKMLNVVLEEDSKQMEEVVVTGYQTVNRRDMVGSYTTVRADDILMPAYTSIDKMLQGQVAGMVVMNTSSRVGTSPKIKIRGTTTILGNQAPIWVVDGIIQEDPIELDATTYKTQDLETIIGSQVSWLNPMDIETITVLKDASATAIYGSKASNGVIVITTKKGKADRLTINYSGNVSINSKPNYGQFNYMNSQERIVFSQEAFNAGAFYQQVPLMQPYTYEGAMQMYLQGELSHDEFNQRKAYLETINTDWFDLLTQSAVSQNHNVSVSGGSEKVTYNVSAGYSNSLGQEIGNSSEKLTGRLSVDVRLRENLRLNVTMNGNTGTNKAFGEGVNPMGYATSTSRAIPAYDENGDPLFYRERVSGYIYNSKVTSLGYNFMNERDNSGSKVENTYFSSSLNFSWDIVDWLRYEFSGGYTRSQTNNESWSLEKTFKIAREYRGYDYNTVDPGSAEFKAAIMPFGGELFTSDALQSSYNIQNKLLMSKTFDENHRLNVMLGMEIRSSRVKNNSNTVYGYAPDRGEKIIKPTYPGDIVPITGSVDENWGVFENLYDNRWNRTKKTDNYLSFFATMAYSLKNRYVFNFSIRNDASNRFGQDVNHRIDPTYSFGLSWRVMEEPFFSNVSAWLNALNLRLTYGIQGNALTRVGPDLMLTQGSVVNIYNQFESMISSIPNPNLSWEKTHTFDLGVDFELFRMFTMTFDYYWRSSNAVVSQDIAYEYGVSTMKLNGGKIQNSGVEFTVSFTPIQRKDWALSVSLNSSKNWNEAKSQQYAAKRGEMLAGSSEKILKKGYPLSGFWSYSFAGLSPEDGRPLFNYLDVPEEERDSNIDPSTFLVYSGEAEPAFTGGLNLSLRYKNLSLSSSFALLLGAKKRLQSPYESFSYGVYIPSETSNLSKDLNKRWKKPGDEEHTIIPGFVKTSLYSLTLPDKAIVIWMDVWAQSDVMVVDASFFRCRQITLSWNMGQEFCKKIGIKSLGLSASVDNVFVIASKRFNGFDPELGDSVQPKNYSFGINVGF